VPAGVEVLGYVDREVYRALLGQARVLAIAARPLVYPSGQSVLLEAMAMGRAVVVTDSEAIGGYVADGVTALTVPSGDPSALRQRIVDAAGDDALRRRLGQAGRGAVEQMFNARRMWGTVANDLLELCH
jgi:glycosyltransferase involved in cell wall biosynthesis